MFLRELSGGPEVPHSTTRSWEWSHHERIIAIGGNFLLQWRIGGDGGRDKNSVERFGRITHSPEHYNASAIDYERPQPMGLNKTVVEALA